MNEETKIKLGLGEVIARLIEVEFSRKNGINKNPDSALRERDLLFDALNEIKLDIGLDCNGDGIPDSVKVFERSANTNCCRIIPVNMTKSQEKDKDRRLRRSKNKRKK
jgi:hypothetical protein